MLLAKNIIVVLFYFSALYNLAQCLPITENTQDIEEVLATTEIFEEIESQEGLEEENLLDADYTQGQTERIDMKVLEEEQLAGDILAVEEEMSNNEVTEKELNDIATTTLYLFDEEEMNQDLPVEEESNKGKKDEKRCFWCKDIQENIVDVVDVLSTTSVPQISEEKLEEEQMGIETDQTFNELKHSENHHQDEIPEILKKIIFQFMKTWDLMT